MANKGINISLLLPKMQTIPLTLRITNKGNYLIYIYIYITQQILKAESLNSLHQHRISLLTSSRIVRYSLSLSLSLSGDIKSGSTREFLDYCFVFSMINIIVIGY
jgi:hypothetical protein